uniref:Uncharacterized protein n=1 Tax=Anopheles albimanus TaxID=7167 RepID=A0A182FWR9_ANOAL
MRLTLLEGLTIIFEGSASVVAVDYFSFVNDLPVHRDESM